MRLETILATLCIGTTVAAAQPAAPPPPEDPYPPEEAAPADPPPSVPAPSPTVTAPPGAPITITITNNNNGNNSNTNTQTTTAPVTVSTPVDVSTSTPVTISPPSTVLAPPATVETAGGRYPAIERVQLLAPARAFPRWLALGVIGGERGAGVRAQIDLRRRGRMSFGLAANASAGHGHGHGHGLDHGHGDRTMTAQAPTASAVAFLAYTRLIGRLEARAQIGAGVELGRRADESGASDTIARTVVGGDPMATSQPKRVTPRGEAALLVALPLGARFALVAGPIVSATRGDNEQVIDTAKRHHGHPEVDARFMAGLRLGF